MTKTFIKPFPRVVRIEPSAACNLACSHCPTGTTKMTRGIMSWDTFERILRSIKDNLSYVKVVVLYHGGEPFLNKNFVQMLKEIKNQNQEIFVKTVTNGMLLKDEIIEGVVKYKLDLIEFSLDAESPQQSEIIRRNSNFEAIKKNVHLLIAYKIKTNLEKPEINLSTTQFVDPKNYSKNQSPPAPQYLTEHFNTFLEKKFITKIKLAYAMRWSVMNIEPQYDLFFDPYDTETKNFCDHVENTVTVRYNGDVVACCYDLTSAVILGNICESNLHAIWNNTTYIELRKGIAERKFNNLCNNCNVVKPNVFLVPKKGFLPSTTVNKEVT